MKFENRHLYLGASDAAAVIGLNPWKTPLELWSEKTLIVPAEDISEKLSVKLGHMCEETVAQLFMEETGKKVRRIKKPYIHKKYDFIQCHIDRSVVGEKSILQCKTCSEWKAKDWINEEIPISYILQEYHEMACTGVDKAYFAVLIGNSKFIVKEIYRDDQAIQHLIEKEVDFWLNYVIPKRMPHQIHAHDNTILKKLYPKSIANSIINLDYSTNSIFDSLDRLKNDKKIIENQIACLENEVKSILKENEYGQTDLWKTSWKLTKGGKRRFNYWRLEE